MKRVLMPLGHGFEEIEAIAVVDILRRGGVEVVVAGTQPGPLKGRGGVQVLADVELDDVGKDQSFDMLVIPGGPGVAEMARDARVLALIRDFHRDGRWTAAICAAPLVLAAAGIMDGKRATSYPSVRDDLSMTVYSEDRVAEDGAIITSRGPGTAEEFALTLLERLCGRETREKVAAEIVARAS